MPLPTLLRYFSDDLAIDLGTANTLVFTRNGGIVVREPSVVVINKVTNKIEAVGNQAKEMLGRTPGNIESVRPMKDGVIADFDVTEQMLKYFIKKAHGGRRWVRPRIVIGVPSEITPVEKRAVRDSAEQAGASEVYLVEQAMMAAIGAGLPITEPSGNMIVDIGGGTSDVAVISLAGAVYSRSLKVAGNEIDEAIINYLKRRHNLLIGERTAELVKFELGSAYPLKEELRMEIKGRDLVEGVPKTLVITDSEVREALAEQISAIVEAVRQALERTPPELSADIMDKGIVLSGGGALIRNLDQRLREETGLPCGAGRRSPVLGGARYRACARRHQPAAQGLVAVGSPWGKSAACESERFFVRSRRQTTGILEVCRGFGNTELAEKGRSQRGWTFAAGCKACESTLEPGIARRPAARAARAAVAESGGTR